MTGNNEPDGGIFAFAATTSPGWYAIAGALGAAVVVSVGNQLVAHRQRKAEYVRLERQLRHDREERSKELQAAADRLERQLTQDREQRELEHVRVVLGPIFATAVSGNGAHIHFLDTIRRAILMPEGQERDLVIARAQADLGAEAGDFLRDATLVAGIVGPHAGVIECLVRLADHCKRLGTHVKDWQAGLCTEEEVVPRLQELDDGSGELLGQLMLAVNATDVWVAARSQEREGGNSVATKRTTNGFPMPAPERAEVVE